MENTKKAETASKLRNCNWIQVTSELEVRSRMFTRIKKLMESGEFPDCFYGDVGLTPDQTYHLDLHLADLSLGFVKWKVGEDDIIITSRTVRLEGYVSDSQYESGRYPIQDAPQALARIVGIIRDVGKLCEKSLPFVIERAEERDRFRGE